MHIQKILNIRYWWMQFLTCITLVHFCPTIWKLNKRLTLLFICVDNTTDRNRNYSVVQATSFIWHLRIRSPLRTVSKIMWSKPFSYCPGPFYLQSVINSFYLKIWWLPGVLILKPNLASICSISWLSTIGRNQFIISVKIPQNDFVIEC